MEEEGESSSHKETSTAGSSRYSWIFCLIECIVTIGLGLFLRCVTHCVLIARHTFIFSDTIFFPF